MKIRTPAEPGRPGQAPEMAAPPHVAGNAALANSRCPRCGGGFHCGAAADQPCACTAVHLGAGLQAGLQTQFSGCLCLACLRQLAAANVPAEQEASR